MTSYCNLKIFIIILVSLIISAVSSFGQVSKAKYYLKYDQSTKSYTCHMVVTQGSATTSSQRQIGKTRVSIAKYGYQITNIRSLAPFTDGFNGSGTEAVQWVISDTSSINSDYVAFKPLSISAFFNTMTTGDTIALFSFNTFPIDSCGTEIRLFNNPTDLFPNSINTLGLAENFVNELGLGMPSVNVYDGNIIANNRPKILGSGLGCVGNTINLTPPNGIAGNWSFTGSNLASITGNILTLLSPGTLNISFNANNDDCRYTLPPIIINNVPVISIPSTNLCLGSSMQALPALPGIWTSSNTNVLTISNTGKITTLGAGMATIFYTNPTTTCSSLISAPITVGPGPSVNITGSNNLCIGQTTTLTPVTGGTWSVENPTIGGITNNGIFTGFSAGITYAIFTSSANMCQAFSDSIQVSQGATISFAGGPTICLGRTLQALSNGSGTWSTTDPSIATIDQTGKVTGIAIGATTVKLTNAIGCVSESSSPVIVLAAPIITGDQSSMCVNETRTLTSSISGQWSSTNPSIATVASNGVVTAINSGETTISVSSNTGCPSVPFTITVNASPTINGSNSICIGGTLALTANNLGGTWASANSAIVAINQNGIATGITAGNTTVKYTDIDGCESLPFPISVTSNAQVAFVGPSTVCAGSTTQMSPNPSNGIWSTSNASIATVNNQGVVSGISAGNVTVSYMPASGGCTYLPSPPLTVIANTVTIPNSLTMCLNTTTSVTPNVNGTWESSNTVVATVSSPSGLIRANSVGFSNISVTTNNGCRGTMIVEVLSAPTITIPADKTHCVGDTLEFQPSGIGKIWTSNNPSIAKVINGNKIVGLAGGSVTFTFTDENNPCPAATSQFTFFAGQVGSVSGGATSLCVGNNVQLVPSNGGEWSFTSPQVATVTLGGFVTATGAGLAGFVFTDTSGCESPILSIPVNPTPLITNQYNTQHCLGSFISFTSNLSGQWGTSNPNVATIGANGLATFVGAGSVFFSITSPNGCRTNTSTLNVFPKPIVIIEGPDLVCPGSAVTLTASSASNYSWSTGATTQSTTINISNSGSIAILTVTDANTCTNSASKIINLLPVPNVNIMGQNGVCAGQTTTLTASGGALYRWSNNAMTSSIFVGPGTYVVTVTGTNGCTNSATKTVSQLPSPNVAISGQNMVCPGSCAIITASGGVTYSWTNGANVPSICFMGGNIGVTVTDANGCTASTSTVVTVLPQPLISVGNSEIMVGSQAVLNSNSAGTWLSSNASIASIIDNQRVLGIAEGMADLIFTDGVTGCKDTLKITVLKSTSTDDGKTEAISIYPNPSDDIINIVSNDAVEEVTIYDNQSRKLFTQSANEISIGHFPQGIYFLRVNTKLRSSTFKILKL